MARTVILGRDVKKVAVFVGGPRGTSRLVVDALPERIDGYLKVRTMEDFDGLPGREGALYKYDGKGR